MHATVVCGRHPLDRRAGFCEVVLFELIVGVFERLVDDSDHPRDVLLIDLKRDRLDDIGPLAMELQVLKACRLPPVLVGDAGPSVPRRPTRIRL
jgi:hypothetical protein